MDTTAFAARVAAKTRLSDEQAQKFIEAFCQALAENFQKGEKVVMAEFGSFVILPDKTVQFNPSAKLKEIVG